jgi:hypothetical protein
MKNKTFLVIISWSVLWALITLNYFSSIRYGILEIAHFFVQHGFELLALLYGITGITVNYYIIKEEFKLRNKYRKNNNV